MDNPLPDGAHNHVHISDVKYADVAHILRALVVLSRVTETKYWETFPAKTMNASFS